MIKDGKYLEHKIGSRTYKLTIEEGSTWGELHDALFCMKSYVVERLKEIQENEKPLLNECKSCEAED